MARPTSDVVVPETELVYSVMIEVNVNNEGAVVDIRCEGSLDDSEMLSGGTF